MRESCVILGPTKIEKIETWGNIKDIDSYVEEVAIFMAENFKAVLIIPDNTLALKIARVYKKNSDSGKVIGYVPERNSESVAINQYYKFCDEVRITEGGWFNLNTSLTKNSNFVFAFGFSAGVLIELCSIKYNQVYLNLDTHIYIDERIISGRLPKEVEIDLKNLFYFDNFATVGKMLKLNQ